MGKWVCEKHITAFDIGSPCIYCGSKQRATPEHTIRPADLAYAISNGLLPIPPDGRMTVKTFDDKVLFRYSVGVALAIYNPTNNTAVPDQLVNLGCHYPRRGYTVLPNEGIEAVRRAFRPLGVVI